MSSHKTWELIEIIILKKCVIKWTLLERSSHAHKYPPPHTSDQNDKTGNILKLSLVIKCYKDQGYRDVAAMFTTLIKIAPTDKP